MTAVIDTNHDVTRHLEQLKALGVKTVIRYINPLNVSGEKTVKEPEARAIAAAGLRLGLVCEGWGGAGDFEHNDINAKTGARDGLFCHNHALAIGAPPMTVVWFAIDTDASGGAIKSLVLPYFEAVQKAMGGKFLIGVYGSGAVCNAVLKAGLADAAWISCSGGWTGTHQFLEDAEAKKPGAFRWTLRQHTPAHLAGIDCDPNDANGSIGDFVPFAHIDNAGVVPARGWIGALLDVFMRKD